MARVKLLKIFEDVKPRYTARTSGNSYIQEFEVVKRSSPEPITLERLAEYVEGLNQRYPDREFYLDEREVDGKRFIVLSQRRRPERGIKRLEREIAEAREEREAILSELIRVGKEIEGLRRERRRIAKRLRWIAKKPFLIRLLLKPLEAFSRRRYKGLREELRELEERYKRLSEAEAKLTERIKASAEELKRLRKSGVRGVIPLYFDLEAQEVYIPKSVWEKKRKNATYVIHRCLGALGYSTTRYVRTVGRAIR